MVLPSPLAWEPLPRRPRRRWLTVFGALATIAALFIGQFWIRLPYYTIGPGSARETSDLIVAEGAPEKFPPEGDVLLTTVSLGEVTPLDAVRGWVDPDVDVVPRDDIVPPETSDEEYREISRALMDDSQQTAVVVALRRLGHVIAERGKGGLIAGVLAGSPADGKLKVGDVITSVDGKPTPLSQDVVAAIRAHQPGDTVTLDVAPFNEGESRTEQVVLAADPQGIARLGVEVRTAGREFDLPFDVEIDAGRIGGPSAGLAFALALIDVLTPGELTGGQRVAVTGTINIDGSVGAVGGVVQKGAAVREAGVKVFIVPSGEAEAARRRSGPGTRVIAVDNLEDALTALGSLGGDLSAIGPGRAGTQG